MYNVRERNGGFKVKFTSENMRLRPSKLQAPNLQPPHKLQSSSSNSCTGVAQRFGAWTLVFHWSLDVGAWSFPLMLKPRELAFLGQVKQAENAHVHGKKVKLEEKP